jgi:hypothetical protein
LERWRAQLSRWKSKAPPQVLNGRSRSSCLRAVLVEIPALRFNDVDVQVVNRHLGIGWEFVHLCIDDVYVSPLAG